MAQAITRTLSAQQRQLLGLPLSDLPRMMLVIGCALALIMAGK